MAYVSKEKMMQVRSDLKREFPEIKFKVNKGTSHSTVYVTIVSAPYRFIEQETPYVDVNRYHMDQGYAGKALREYRSQNPGSSYYDIPEHAKSYYGHIDILKRILDIINVGNWDKSDSQSDYFNVGFYVDLQIGEYSKPFICTATEEVPA